MLNADWLDNCLTVIYQLMTVDYDSVSSKACVYYKWPINANPPPLPRGGMEGLRIDQQQYQELPTIDKLKASLFHESRIDINQ